jgi:hypothetical protein
MLNWILSILVIKKQLTLKQAKALSHVLHRTIHPQEVEEAIKIVDNVLKNPDKSVEEAT